MDDLALFLRNTGLILLALMGLCLILGLLVLWLAARQVRHLDVPEDATFAETLHYTPFMVVLGIDLLDFGLDFLAAPIAWVILDNFGLKALRGFTVVEAIIPGTQLLPTMTLAWLGVRLSGYQKPAALRDGRS
ncbi:MAG: hypothetical protein KDE59_29600 [Anaerolineales bacterium]|nr:hypothetical protein [Anaerolineales bacterium]MCB0006261.1 hypothetical protein [Anaerolineales bacterium]